MTHIVPLNNVEHKNLKISTRHTEMFGCNVNAVIAFPSEFSDIQMEYPILFKKNATTNQYQAIALLGIEQGENLFIKNGEWSASYIPAIIARDPFIIGFEDQSHYGGEERAPIMMIDMDSPRVSEQEGQPVFLEFGGNTPYLEKINQILHGMYQGTAMADTMFAMFSEMNLIEPVTLEVKLKNGDLHRITGNYTISREKLQSLTASELEKLNKAGFLEGAFLVISSLNNMKRLIEIKNSKI